MSETTADANVGESHAIRWSAAKYQAWIDHWRPLAAAGTLPEDQQMMYVKLAALQQYVRNGDIAPEAVRREAERRRRKAHVAMVDEVSAFLAANPDGPHPDREVVLTGQRVRKQEPDIAEPPTTRLLRDTLTDIADTGVLPDVAAVRKTDKTRAAIYVQFAGVCKYLAQPDADGRAKAAMINDIVRQVAKTEARSLVALNRPLACNDRLARNMHALLRDVYPPGVAATGAWPPSWVGRLRSSKPDARLWAVARVLHMCAPNEDVRWDLVLSADPHNRAFIHNRVQNATAQILVTPLLVQTYWKAAADAKAFDPRLDDDAAAWLLDNIELTREGRELLSEQQLNIAREHGRASNPDALSVPDGVADPLGLVS